MNSDPLPELRMVRQTPPEGEASPDVPESAPTSDLVAELLGDTDLLPPEKVEELRARARGASFEQALLEDTLAESLAVARDLARQHHLPLVDLAVAGIDPVVARLIPLTVLERVKAVPFARAG